MASQYQLVVEAQAEASRVFGRMLRRWRELNGWTQYTPEKWAFESGFIVLRHSNLSQLENGKGQPRFKTFLCLAELNRRLALHDMTGVRSRDLKDQLQDAEPLIDDEGLLWGPAQFWECHHGLRTVPLKYQVSVVAPPALTVSEAETMSKQWRAHVLETAKAAGLKPIEMLSQAAKIPPPTQRDHFQSVLMGMVDYTPEELNHLWDTKAAMWLPELWVQRWAAAVMPPPPLRGGGGY
jgi:transcriptional regulator with XRE-family HTH domain